MVDFSRDAAYKQAASNPAGPSGLQQQASSIAEGRAAYARGDSPLQPWQPEKSWLDQAKYWYTGANSESTQNGWDSAFWRQSWDNIDTFYNKAAESGKGSQFFGMFDHDKATGVAMWDDPNGRFKFGDVFLNGAKQDANLYDDYDKPTADVMMGEFMFSREEKGRIFEHGDREARMADAVAERRREWSDQARYAPQAEQYQEDVAERKEQFREGVVDDVGAFALGAGASATMGASAAAITAAGAAALGFSWTGPGALVAAAIAGTVGGIGAWMNKDHISDLAARAYVDTEKAWEHNRNPLTTVGAAVGNASGVAMKAASPLSNIYQGTWDILSPNGWGDEQGEAGFYRTNMLGERVVGGFWQGVDVGLSIGDGALQFSSKAAVRLYTATMGAAVAGGVNDQVMGATFNPAIGAYDPFDRSGERWAALGSTGIDLAQLGMARALGSAAANARAAVGIEGAAASRPDLAGKLEELGDRAWARIKGEGTFAPGATTYETLNGIRFGLDENLNVVGSRMTMQALVPSEFMRWLPTTWMARRSALDAKRAVPTRDDLYAAAWSMTTKGSRFNDAILNGYAEGAEEFVQSLLDPWAVSENPTMEEIVAATLYGAAGGAGMSLGRMNTRPDNDGFNRERAYALATLRLGRAPSREEFNERWRNSSAMDKRRMYTTTASEEKEINDILEANAEAMAMNATYNSVIGVENLGNLSRDRFATLHRKATEAGQGSVVLLPQASGTLTLPTGQREVAEFGANAAVMSANQVGLELAGISKGLEAQARSLQQKQDALLADLKAMEGATGEDADTERARLQQQIEQHGAMIADLLEVLPITDQVTNWFSGWLAEFRREGDRGRRADLIRRANEQLKSAGLGRWVDPSGALLPPEDQERVRRAVELKIGRHPFINSGSFAMLLPQISVEMTENNIHATVYLHQSTLKAMGADHDGDTGVVGHEKYLSAEERRDKRRGTQYVSDIKGADGRTAHEAVVDMPDNEARYIRLFSEAMQDTGSLPAGVVHQHLNELVRQLRTTLGRSTGGVVDDAVLDTLLRQFKDGIAANNPEARQELLNGLLNSSPNAVAELLGLSDGVTLDGMPFVSWFMHTINFQFDLLQRNLATRFQTDPSEILTGESANPRADTAYMDRLARRDAATAGAQLTNTIESIRAAQQLHYSALYRTLTIAGARESQESFTTPEQEELVELYARLGSDMTMSELDMTLSKDSIEKNVLAFLDRIVKESTQGMEGRPLPELRLLMANLAVPDIRPTGDGGYSVEVGKTSLLQLLLRKALEIEEQKLTNTSEDTAARLRIKKLRTLAYPKKTGHSYTASTVMVEIFGNQSMYDLVGDAAMFLGPEITLGQLAKMAAGMSSGELSNFFHNLKRSSAYIKDSEIKDPPWTREQLESGGVNAFSMLIDAVKTYTDTERAAMKGRDDTLSENFRKGLDELRNLLDDHQSRTKGLPAGRDRDARVAVLRDLLAKRPDVVSRIAALIPDAASLGVFEVMESGEVRQANWLEDVLTMEDSARAEVVYYVQVKLAEFNQMGGTVRYDPENEQGEGSRGTVRYDQIKSRFLQTVYYLAKHENSLELFRFLRTASNASSLEALFEEINVNEPDWLNNRAPLLPYHDDVGLFEIRPQDMWTQDLPYALQREAMEMFSQSMKMAGDSMREARTIELENAADLAEMVKVMKGTSTDARATALYDQLGELIVHRQNFPDSIGPRARDQLMELFQEALIRLHDKGKIDEAARGFGESLVTMDSFGWKGALMQEADAITALDWQDVATNLTKLVEGPVRIQLNNGRILTLDMSSREKALELLADPRTQQFAMAVLLPTVRDVDGQGVLRPFRDTGQYQEDANLLSKLLAPEALRESLFEDRGSKVEQAYRYIGMLESYLRREALQSSQDDMEEYISRNDAAHNPIQHMIDDFLIAYTQGPKWRGENKQKLRDQLVINVANAIKMMANVEPTSYARIREAIVVSLHEQFLGDQGDALEYLGMSEQEREIQQLQLTDMVMRGFKAERDEITRLKNEALASAKTQAERDAIETKFGQQHRLLNERIQAFTDSKEPVSKQAGLLANAVQSTINSMILTGNPAADIPRKIQILDQLGKQNRVNRFRTKNDIELYHKVRRIIYSDRLAVFRSATDEAALAGVDDITMEEWNTLGGWAAASVISDMTARSGSEVALLPLVLGKGGDLVRRYYDTSYGYLLDGFFDQRLLDAATKLATQAGAKRPVSSDEAIRVFSDGLFREGLLGTWTDRVPIESMKLRKVVETTSTGAAIQTEGNDPKSLSAYIAAGKVSTLLPSDDHFTQVALTGPAMDRNFFYTLDPLQRMRMVNRFVRSASIDITQVPANVQQIIDPADLDLFPYLYVNEFDEGVKNSGLRVFNMLAVENRLEELKNKYGPIGPISLQVDFVDPDKLPAGPDDTAWANNIYFVGVGREGYRTSTFGGLAALYFGANGLSKLGQQNPLDAATKKGKRYRAHVPNLLREVEAVEAPGQRIDEVLWKKVGMLLDAHYPTGDLLDEDIPALYQLMLMRHVVVGRNANGEKEVWWPQRFIQMEASGVASPLTDVKLVPLNDSIAQQLHSGAAHGGLRTRVSQQELNLQDITPFASLSPQRLKDLGLEDLGEEAVAWNSPLAQVSVQRHASLVREAQSRANTISQRRRRHVEHKIAVMSERMRKVRSGSGTFNPEKFSKNSLLRLNEHMRPSVVASLMRRMGVPFADFDGHDAKITRPILRSLSRQADSNTNQVVWYHDHETPDPGVGVLSKHSLSNNFEDLEGVGPTYEDFVVINISTIERSNRGGNVEKAVRDVIRSYADYGVKIILVVDDGRRDVLNSMYNWLESGAIGYRSIAGSPNFYEPIAEDPRDGENRRMLNSTLTQSDVIDTDGVALGLATDELATYISENGGIADLQYDAGWKRVVANILPARILATGSTEQVKDPYLFAVPSQDDSRSWDRIRSTLLPLLRTEDGLDHLVGLAGGTNGNPKGAPLARTIKKTGEKIPGVQDMREALIELRNILEANSYPLAAGRVLQMGSVLPTLGRDGSILLTRVGFPPPDMLTLGNQLEAGLGQTRKRPGTKGLNIAVSPAKLDKDATIGPAFTVRKVKETPRGLSVIGEADISGYAKTIFEGTGFKMGAVPMPSSLRFKDAVMQVGAAVGTRLTRIVSERSLIGKEATPGLVDNFAEMFVVAGINFEHDLMKFFYKQDPKSMSEDEYSAKWDSLQNFLKQWAEYDHGMTAEEIVSILDRDFGQGVFENVLNAQGLMFFGGQWQNVSLPTSDQPVDVESRIATVLLATLAAPGVELQHVIGTPGLMTVANHTSGLLVRRLPTMLSDALSDPSYPQVRKELIGRVNNQMPKRPDGMPIYWFDEQMNFHALLEEQVNGKWTDREVVGQLQVQLPIVNDVNGDTLAMAALTTEMAMSPHVVNVQNAAEGGYLTTKPRKTDEQGNVIDSLPDRVDEIFGDNEILRFESGDGAVVWDMLSRVMQSDPSYSPWERQLPLAERHRVECDAIVRQYTKPIDKSDEQDWSEENTVRANAAADEILKVLGLTVPSIAANRDEIDFLVRQWYGAPAAAKPDEEMAAKITAEEYIQAARAMLDNIKSKLHPLHTADVPLEHVAFWRKVFEAQASRPASARWAPAASETLVDGKVVQSNPRDWAGWVHTIMGQMRESNESFDGIFSNALDGFYHTYQGASPDYLVTALSLDERKQARLYDTNANRTYLSVDPSRDALLSNPVLIDSQLVTYEALAGHKPEFTDRDADTAETSPRAKRRQRQQEYRVKKKITKQKETTFREYQRSGLAFQESSRRTSEFMSSMVNLSISMRLANPALYVSAMIEVPFRNMLERATNVLQGTYTGVGAAQVGALGEKVGIRARYTPEDLAAIDMLVDQLGESNTLLGEIFHEMIYADPMAAKSRTGRALESLATKVARVSSDPRWGMKANSVARRYVEAALTHLEMTDSGMTVPQFVELLKRDPLWLKRNSGEGFTAHRAGVNAVTQVRSTRPTVLGRGIMAPIDRMTQSGSGFVNGAGHLLKLPFMFTRFNINQLATLTGLDALDQVAAMMMDGRKSPELIKRMGHLMRQTEYDVESAPRMDYSDVLQSIDLSRVFVRGAVTQTGLMAAALMAVGRGLGGEDEEERRRRKLATYLNIPFIRDPREAQNDFRFKDAVFLDNVPGLETWFHREDIDRSVVVPHWILRQFLSPVLGTMRFFETGDLNEVRYGFWDAAAAIPTSALNLWREADATGDLLAAAAQDASLDPQKDQQVNQLIVNTVGIYEKALLENQFVNAIRQAMDPIDRNPWLMPRTAEENTGELDRLQGSDLPQETNALVDVLSPEQYGQDEQLRKTYLKRETRSAQLHAYTESNGTAALLMSLISGQGFDSSYLRKNMVPKERTAAVDEASKSEVEAAVLAAWEAQGGQPMRTHREILQQLRDVETAAGRFWDNEELNDRADAIFAAEQAMNYRTSLFDEDAQEVLNTDLETGMFKSLHSGMVNFGDPITAGFWASPETRDAIAREWLTELVEEGMALGLTQDAAKYRADRFWWGDSREGWTGLRELLYSSKIPKDGEAEYLQQNVTYVIGPDGKPWATPFEKSNLLGTVIPYPRELVDPGPGLALDSRGNVIDKVRNINTGMAGLLQKPQEPEKVEINDDILDEIKKKDFGDGDPTAKKFSRYPSRSYSGSGGSGPYFQRMLPLPEVRNTPRPDDIPFINANTPYVRRSRVNTERIYTERGRLKQWQ